MINGTYRPYRKPNDNPIYININSNHPLSTKKRIPKSISKRISKFSSNEEIFNNNIRTHSDALKICQFQEKPIFIPETPSDPHAKEKRKYRRNIVWFNSSYSMHIKTNICKAFLNLLHKQSPTPPHPFSPPTPYVLISQNF